MPCGVRVTGDNQGDRNRLRQGDSALAWVASVRCRTASLPEAAAVSGRVHLVMRRRGDLSVSRVTPQVMEAKGQWPVDVHITTRKEPTGMSLDDLVAALHTHRPHDPTPGRPEVVLRIAGKDYTIRGIYASTAHVIIEGGEEMTPAALSPERLVAAPGGPEGEGGEPAPPADRQQAGDHEPQATTAVPRHVIQQAAQITPVAESVPDVVLDEPGGQEGTDAQGRDRRG
jgi:hypothetical protein